MKARRESLPKARSGLRLHLGEPFELGPGKVELLARIGATGSIAGAARQMSMSYNRAWLHVQALNHRFASPLVASKRGGAVGGGTGLTETGRRVLALYRQLEAEAQASTERTRQQVLRLLRPTLGSRENP
ncbi:MAG: LysR family transcriptional regulator [Verrucomicrobia bacterium]|jgi:molybdate transport system regulatory protein|nr:LysR family transcriptional regulator [Verrucomicrobiota bacterium]